MKLWFCNFNSQLANALIIEGDYQNSISALERGFNCATEICYIELQVFTDSDYSILVLQYLSLFSSQKGVYKDNFLFKDNFIFISVARVFLRLLEPTIGLI